MQTWTGITSSRTCELNDDVRLIHGDCLQVLPTLDLASIDAVIADPPYGMDWDTDSTRFSGGESKLKGRDRGRGDWDRIVGDLKPFDPSPWMEFPRVVLWGSNHYGRQLPIGTTLVWVKRNEEAFGSFLSDAEIAWMKGGHGVYCFMLPGSPQRSKNENRSAKSAHPNQKPIRLMSWCIEKLGLEPGSTILDPYMGSGTTGVAAIKAGCSFIGIEIEERHFATAQRRISEASTPLLDAIT